MLEIERLERTLGSIDLGDWKNIPIPSPCSTSWPASASPPWARCSTGWSASSERRPFDLLAVSGGAAANRLLRRELPAWAERHGVELRLVPLVYSGDNAAMIAHAALLRHRRGSAG